MENTYIILQSHPEKIWFNILSKRICRQVLFYFPSEPNLLINSKGLNDLNLHYILLFPIWRETLDSICKFYFSIPPPLCRSIPRLICVSFDIILKSRSMWGEGSSNPAYVMLSSADPGTHETDTIYYKAKYRRN